MGASTGKLIKMIGTVGPILKYHVLDKISCVLLLVLEYTIMQLIMGILSLKRFTERKGKITLLFILSTWFPLCDGQRRDDAGFPFQSLVGHGNIVMGIMKGDECREDPSLRGYCRPGYSPPGRVFDHEDGLYLGSLCLHSCDDFHYSCVPSLTIPDLLGHHQMSTSGESPRNDAVVGIGMGSGFIRSSVKAAIKALSGGPKFATPVAEIDSGAKETNRGYFEEQGFSDELALDDFPSYVSQGIDRPGTREEILRQATNRVHLSTANVSRGNEFQGASTEEVSHPIAIRVGSDEGIPQHSDDITDERGSGGDSKPEENFIPEIRSRFGLTDHHASTSQAKVERRKMEHGLVFNPDIRLIEHGLGYPDTSVSYPLARPSSHVPLCSFHPGPIGNYEGFHAREGASEAGHSTRYGREDTQNVTQRDNKRPKERSRDKAYKTRFSLGSFTGMDRSPVPPPPPPLGGAALAEGRGVCLTRASCLCCFRPKFTPSIPVLSVGSSIGSATQSIGGFCHRDYFDFRRQFSYPPSMADNDDSSADGRRRSDFWLEPE